VAAADPTGAARGLSIGADGEAAPGHYADAGNGSWFRELQLDGARPAVAYLCAGKQGHVPFLTSADVGTRDECVSPFSDCLLTIELDRGVARIAGGRATS